MGALVDSIGVVSVTCQADSADAGGDGKVLGGCEEVDEVLVVQYSNARSNCNSNHENFVDEEAY